jgi:NAD(P)-dependent dehydrogenase (short-subunit alcohol dehydrogenase family)
MDTATKVALVTGANKGIGKEIARGLARQGMTVLLGARDSERGQAAAAELAEDGNVTFLQLDVTDVNSVSAAAREIETRFGRLDILVNNAGRNISRTTPSETTAAEVREVYETNVFGAVTVTHEMLPLLRRSAAARIVNMSSSLGSLALASDPASQQYPVMLLSYNSSKSALNAITIQYAKELRDTPIKINAACPGYCATDLNDHQGYRTPEQGAEIAIRLATLDEHGPTGGYFDENGPLPW